MKKSILWNPLRCISIWGYNLVVDGSDLKMDFSGVNDSQIEKKSIEKKAQKRNDISSYLILVLFFLFTNFLFAQQPACNLNGVLEAKRLKDGGQNFTINPDLYKTVPGTIYRWEFTSNNSSASFATQNGLPSMTINPGNKNGEFNIKLTLINPPNSWSSTSKTCSCTKSVSIGKI